VELAGSLRPDAVLGPLDAEDGRHRRHRGHSA
jgi:hypothetical protein